MNDVYLLLGSNIDPELNIPAALRSLQASSLLEVKKISSIWHTKAVDSEGADFLNVAVNIATDCELSCLKEMVIREIEKKLGRVRTEDKNAPRTIDLDVIVINDQVIDKSLFTLDHIILPMAELLPDLYSEEFEITLQKLSDMRLKQTLARRLQ